MIRKITLILLISALLAAPVFADERDVSQLTVQELLAIYFANDAASFYALQDMLDIVNVEEEAHAQFRAWQIQLANNEAFAPYYEEETYAAYTGGEAEETYVVVQAEADEGVYVAVVEEAAAEEVVVATVEYEAAEEVVVITTEYEAAEEIAVVAAEYEAAEGVAAVTAEEEAEEVVAVAEDEPLHEEVLVAAEDIPEGIRYNRYYLESRRLTRLAHETFEFGDYVASAGFAREAIIFAQRSDEFVAVQLVAEARRLLDWAEENDIPAQYPSSYREAVIFHEAGIAFLEEEELNQSINASVTSIGIISAFQGRVDVAAAPPPGDTMLPAQYTVRTWAGERDSLWTIAGYSFVFGDPRQWVRLFEANRHRMPDPNNPDLIHPGFVLDIPSLPGETRQGMWQPPGN